MLTLQPWFLSQPRVQRPATRLGAAQTRVPDSLFFFLSAWWKTFAFWEVTPLSRANLWRTQDKKAGFGPEVPTGLSPSQSEAPSGSGVSRGLSYSRRFPLPCESHVQLSTVGKVQVCTDCPTHTLQAAAWRGFPPGHGLGAKDQDPLWWPGCGRKDGGKQHSNAKPAFPVVFTWSRLLQSLAGTPEVRRGAPWLSAWWRGCGGCLLDTWLSPDSPGKVGAQTLVWAMRQATSLLGRSPRLQSRNEN